MGRVVLRALDVWKSYEGCKTRETAALRGVSLDLVAGEAVALYGKSGSGKTTLLNLLAGLDRPSGGRLEIEGQDLTLLGEPGRTRMRRLRMGFVFQFFNLLPTLTSLENVYLSLELAGRPDRAVAASALASVGLSGKEGRYPHELSGGEQQRVAIARAVVKSPAVILADEPTGNLDTATGELVLGILTERCREQGAALLMATHSPLTCRWATRILRMVDGVVVAGTPCDEA